MTKTGMAVYEDGVLRLLTPLALPERSRVRVYVELVDQELTTSAAETDAGADPVSDLIGAYCSPLPLIDGIPASEDPDLYLVAEMMGERARGLHAWEIAPARYVQGRDGRAVRRDKAGKAR